MKVIQKLVVVFLLVFIIGHKGVASTYPGAMFQTDRHCYISGDIVLLKIVLPQHNESTVYVDLADESNTFFAGEILKLNNGSCSGFLALPDTLKTGNYVLRTYTYSSQMNNQNKFLCKNKIYITNRFGNNAELFHSNNHYDYKNDTVVSDEVELGPVSFSLSKEIYAKRDLVTLNTVLNNELNDEKFSGVITVRTLSACEQQCDEKNGLWWKNGKIRRDNNPDSININEKKGIVISGIARHKTTGSVLPNLAVFMSFEDTILRFNYSITDSLGKFYFVVNDCFQEQDLFLAAYSYPKLELYTNVQFDLDNKFILRNGHKEQNGKILGYQHSRDSLNLLKSIIAKAYNIKYIDESISCSSKATYVNDFASGEFDRVTNIDDYIDLPDFYQIAKEILPFVRIREKDGKYNFELFDGENHVVRENPLVFIDGVPMTDCSDIMPWGTSKIKRVDVKVEQRYFGDLPIENGMVLIWTRERDFWKSANCTHVHKFTVPCYQQQIEFDFPDYSNKRLNKLPDYRQVMYWNPDVSLLKGEQKQHSFYTSDEVGLFEVCLAGLMTDGTPVYIRKYFEVK